MQFGHLFAVAAILKIIKLFWKCVVAEHRRSLFELSKLWTLSLCMFMCVLCAYASNFSESSLATVAEVFCCFLFVIYFFVHSKCVSQGFGFGCTFVASGDSDEQYNYLNDPRQIVALVPTGGKRDRFRRSSKLADDGTEEIRYRHGLHRSLYARDEIAPVPNFRRIGMVFLWST